MNKHAQILGRMGGKATKGLMTPRKLKAVRKNIAKAREALEQKRKAGRM
jgi:ribosomal protein L29